MEIWIWQRIVTPHMAHLAVQLAAQGYDVSYVTERLMSADRAKQGWRPPELGQAQLRLIPTAAAVEALIQEIPREVIHVCQGLRGNGLIGVAQALLEQHKIPYWIVMETVEDAGWRGALRRLVYTKLFSARRHLQGVLAIGHRTPEWVVARGVPAEKVYPFAYFLPEASLPETRSLSGRFRFLFVGQFIELKRLSLLLRALQSLGRDDFELGVIGSGPLEKELRRQAEAALPQQIEWVGQVPMESVRTYMREADCLVLPSRHDGWGAVVSEALMVGTPAICSDTCGAAGVVGASGEGGVFPSGDQQALTHLLATQLAQGRVSEDKRQAVAHWAQCLGAEAGAKYLVNILNSPSGLVQAPWELSGYEESESK